MTEPHATAEVAHGYSAAQRALEMLGIAAFMAGTVWTVLRLVDTARSLEPMLAVGVLAAMVVISLLAADFVSGLVHWAADNWGSPTWPLIGPGFIRPFRHHHVEPEAMTRHDFVEMNGNNCIVSLPLFWLVSWGVGGPAVQLAWMAFFLGLGWWVLGTNQFHAWAHTPTPPRLVRALQRARLILDKPHHDVHHASPHDRHYCITNGWLNPVLERIRFFRLLERTITALTGARAESSKLAESLRANSPAALPTR